MRAMTTQRDLSLVMRVARILYAVLVETSTAFALMFVALTAMLSGVAFISEPFMMPQSWSVLIGVLLAHYFVLEIIWAVRRAFNWRRLWQL